MDVCVTSCGFAVNLVNLRISLMVYARFGEFLQFYQPFIVVGLLIDFSVFPTRAVVMSNFVRTWNMIVRHELSNMQYYTFPSFSSSPTILRLEEICFWSWQGRLVLSVSEVGGQAESVEAKKDIFDCYITILFQLFVPESNFWELGRNPEVENFLFFHGFLDISSRILRSVSKWKWWPIRLSVLAE